jgi:CRISPR-associated protein Csd1
MSWVQKLAETYDNCRVNIGYAEHQKQRPLLPICHITAQAHVEIVIDGEGNFRRARLITDKSDSVTIIPSTEGSGSRAGSKPENHPLCDKLQYIAGDFAIHGGGVTSGFSKDPEEPYRNFVKTLAQWCNSEFAHPKAQAVLKYVKKKTVIKDLIKHRILFASANGNLVHKEDVKRDKNAKDIFSVVDPQENAFVRWVVEIPGESESRVWRDKSLWDSWIKYYLRDRRDKSLCYVTGEEQVLTNNHPKYIRREGDGAKIISANDTNGFTFRGRFITDAQACGVGLETSHKSHYALSWLISRQGYKKNELAIVAWATSGKPVPQPTDDPQALLWGDVPTEEDPAAYTAQELAVKLKNRIAGYGKIIGRTDHVSVIAVDSATTGRMAIAYYRDLTGSDFLQRIDEWHKSCEWLHRYGEIQDKQSGKMIKGVPFVGAPAPADIAEAAYGSRLDDKLRKATITRLLPCIVDGQPIPRDLVGSVVRRASNRVGMSAWEWNKTLSIACALFRKFKQGKETYNMSLDETRNTRDYLYGRLLAIADVLEERTLSDAEKNRPTNATRYMQQFSQRPFRTWKQVHELLTPYLMRQGEKASYYKSLIGQVETLFTPEDFISNKPLTGEYLLGYYCQRQKMWKKKDKLVSDETQTPEEK